MASGKQLSFSYGEVAPSLHYKSDAVSYAQGLAKLTNMYVRRTGGVSNRPGFEYVKTCASQLSIPESGGDPGIKGFTFWDYKNSTWRTVECGIFSHPGGLGNTLAFVNGDTGAFIYPQADDGGPVLAPAPMEVSLTPLKTEVLVTPSLEHFGGTNYQASLRSDLVNAVFDFGIFGNAPTGSSVITSTLTYVAGGPFLPVSYFITAILEDGTETYAGDISSGPIASASTYPNTICHPHADLSVTISITIGTPTPLIKAFVLYRGAGSAGPGGTYYKLVSRIPYNGTDTTVKLSDYGADDPAITPPIEKSELYLGSLRGAYKAAQYQQRLFLAIEPGTGLAGNGIPSSISLGDIFASKIGAPGQLVPPMIYSDTQAFKFSIPITDGTPVNALLSMERLIAFTQRGVYVIRGGEQGVLTPTQVNPLMVSEEGNSPVVEPTMSGKRGYFINSSHTKLMEIIFGLDGNLEVKEASAFSEHILLEDVVQLVSLNDAENSLYFLRRNGTIACVSINADGEHGFGVIETDGYIESIYRGKARKKYVPNALNTAEKDRYYDVLMAYIIRNGIRYLERLSIRDDRNRQGEFFADSFVAFGKTLSANGSAGYTWLSSGEPIADIGQNKINIKGPLFGQGQACKIECYSPIVDPGVDFRIHFYYDENGETKTLECEVDIPSETVTGGGYEYTAYFSADVPALLQDVNSQTALTTAQKNAFKTRWLPAVDKIYGDPILNSIFYAAGGVNAGVDVSVMADGEILSSPLNPNKDTIQIVRDPDTSELYINFGGFYANGYIGLPYTSEMETLDIEASDARTLTDANKLINAVGVAFYETRGGFFGMPGKELEQMEELVTREEEDLAAQTANFNGYLTVHIPAEWNKAGRVNMKHVDPTPVTILSVYPKGISSEG